MDTRLVRALGGAVLVLGVAGVVSNGQALAIGGIHVYQRSLSPIAARAGFRCRFAPTCSRYAEITIARDGLARGGWRSLKRIVRCNPLTPMGTQDPP